MKVEKEKEFKKILARLKAKDESLKELNLSGFELDAPAFARIVVYLSEITSLNLAGNQIGPEGVIALVQALPQTQITNLNLAGNQIGGEGIVALALVLPQTKIVNLNLWGNNDLWGSWKSHEDETQWAITLSKVLQQTKIAILDLSGNQMGDEGVIALAQTLPQTSITTLVLAGNQIGDEGVIALAQALPQTSITTLVLAGNQIGDEGVIALAQALPQTSITTLVLAGNQIGDEGVIALAQALPQTSITTFDLGANQIGEEGVIALVQSLPQTNVTTLGLVGNKAEMNGGLGFTEESRPMGRLDGWLDLVRTLPKTKITHIAMADNQLFDGDEDYNELDGEGIITLSQVLPHTEVTNINLANTNLGSEGVVLLAQTLPQTKLSILNLEGNQIEDKGVFALVKVLAQSKLTSLNLKDNWISYDGTIALEQVLVNSQIANLDLRGNEIFQQEVRWDTVLAQATLSSLTNLNLAENKIQATGAAELARALLQTQITTLDLGNNQIGDGGAVALSQVLPQTQISTIDLEGNQIGDAGAVALAQVLPQTKIAALNMESNKIRNKGAIALAQTLSTTNIKSINVGWDHEKGMGASMFNKTQGLEQIQPEPTAINLFGNDIGDAGVSVLARALKQTQTINIDPNLSQPVVGDVMLTKAQKSEPRKDLGLNLWYNEVGYAGAVELVRVLSQTKITSLSLRSSKWDEKDVTTLMQMLSRAKITSLDLNDNHMLDVGTTALAQILPETKIKNLDLRSSKIGEVGAVVLAKMLPQTQITSLDLYGAMGDVGVMALIQILPQTQIITLNLGSWRLKVEVVSALAQVLPQTKITSLSLANQDMDDIGSIALAQTLAQTQITNLDLHGNKISDAVAKALAQVLPQTKIVSLNLDSNKINTEGCVALLRSIKLSFSVGSMAKLFPVNDPRSIMLNNHLEVNTLLNVKSLLDTNMSEFICELEKNALIHINQPLLLDDASFEKPKRLLLKAMELGSVQAMYLLGNLYLNEFKNLNQAKEYYLQAAENGHEIAKLCLQLMEQELMPESLALDTLKVGLPRRFSVNAARRQLTLREEKVSSLGQTNLLVSKAGISLAALNELLSIEAPMDVYVASRNYEPTEPGWLHFNQGQTIYINNFNKFCEVDFYLNFGIRDFASLIKEGLCKSFIPYNKDKQGNRRADVGAISYGMYSSNTHFKPKAREEWTAEEVCNAIIVPMTKPNPGERSKPYVDTLPVAYRGKPFEGYILSYARSTKFADILQSLNERFKTQNPEEIFIWIDLACINQHAWMEMKSEDIGRVLEVNLAQLFTYISEGRLIHFDGPRPTNLTRSWCLVELLSCLRAQEETVAQTEICMTSNVQAQVLAQDLMKLLDALDSSKAQCFNPQDKLAIDHKIKQDLRQNGEDEISMELAFVRLNNVIKGWLVSKFLPNFNNVEELKLQQISWGATLEKLSAEALEVIRFCAYLYPDNIPRVLLEQMVTSKSQDDVLYELRSQSLLLDIDVDRGLLKIHRPLQETVRWQLAKQDGTQNQQSRAIVEKGITVIKSIIGNHETISYTELGVLWRKYDYLHMHINWLLGESEKLAINAALLADLIQWNCEYQAFVDLNYDEALNFYQRSLALRQVLERLSAGALDIIRLCAYLSPDIIPRVLLEQVMANKSQDILYELRSQSLLLDVEGNEGLLKIHRPLQEAVRRRLAKQDAAQNLARRIVEAGIVALKAIIGNHETTAHSELCLFWRKHDYLNAQISCLLAEADNLTIGSALMADLLEWAGEYQEDVSLNYDIALNFYQRSLQLRQAIYADNQADIAQSLFNVGGIYYQKGKYAEALNYAEQALVMRQAVYGDEHPVFARSIRFVGLICDAQGNHAKALEYCQQSLEIRKASYGDKHLDVAISLSDIGFIYSAQTNYTESLKYYEQALTTYRVIYGEQHQDVARTLNDIGLIYYNQGDHAEALQYYQQALAIYKAVFGDRHTETINAENNLKLMKRKLQEKQSNTEEESIIAAPSYEQSKALTLAYDSEKTTVSPSLQEQAVASVQLPARRSSKFQTLGSTIRKAVLGGEHTDAKALTLAYNSKKATEDNGAQQNATVSSSSEPKRKNSNFARLLAKFNKS